MIELTEQQRQQLVATDTPHHLIDLGTGQVYVLVELQAYERLKAFLEDEPRVTGELVDRLMEDEDRDDPTLAFYQQQYGRKT